MIKQNALTTNFVSKKIGKKFVLWEQKMNKYMVVDPQTTNIIKMVLKKIDNDTIIHFCSRQYNIPTEEAEHIVREIKERLSKNFKTPKSKNSKSIHLSPPKQFSSTASTHYYKINNIIFLIEYETLQIKNSNHPKIAHWEIPPQKTPQHHFKVFHSDEMFSLWVDGKKIGSWNVPDENFLCGKFAMQILEKVYARDESKWLGVFHASAVSDGENCIIFLGDSGKGKSTLSAILLANGFDVLSDDFLPVENDNALVCRFPGAISIKRKAYDLLLPQFPILKEIREIYNPFINKSVRYLPLEKSDPLCVPCKALVFVKYKEGSGFSFERILNEKAIEQIIPDSWILPDHKNVKLFFDWIANLSCYQLTYSDNDLMINTVKKLLRSEIR